LAASTIAIGCAVPIARVAIQGSSCVMVDEEGTEGVPQVIGYRARS